MSLRMTALAVLAAALGAAAGRAVPPESLVAKWQQKADEALKIKVTSVKATRVKSTVGKDGAFTLTDDVEVTAEVVGVTRSKSGVKKGDTIKISYSIGRGPFRTVNGQLKDMRPPGDPEPPLLKKGQEKPAYLTRSKSGTFYLAVGGDSFWTATAEN